MEDIEILKTVCEYRKFSGIYTDVECIFKAIENLIERNKELEVINKMQEYRISVIDERELIPKSKIKEKIEELEKKIKPKREDYSKFGIEIVGLHELEAEKQVLQELLESED